MAYDEALAARIRDILGGAEGVAEKKMFGGIAFLINGNMACGVNRDDMIVRLEPEQTDAALAEPHVRLFDMTGRPMKGWVVVGPAGVADDADLRSWVGRGADFARSLPAK
jgi:TfoX N-terminal domain